MLKQSDADLARQKHEALERATSIAERKGEEIQRLGETNAALEEQIREAEQQLTLAEQKAGADQKQNDELSKISLVNLKVG